MAQNLLCLVAIPHILQTKFKKVKHATPPPSLPSPPGEGDKVRKLLKQLVTVP
jgi:hypothetical protein